jgi:hypothetical protein
MLLSVVVFFNNPLPSTGVVCGPENKIETPFFKRGFVTEI